MRRLLLCFIPLPAQKQIEKTERANRRQKILPKISLQTNRSQHNRQFDPAAERIILVNLHQTGGLERGSLRVLRIEPTGGKRSFPRLAFKRIAASTTANSIQPQNE